MNYLSMNLERLSGVGEFTVECDGEETYLALMESAVVNWGCEVDVTRVEGGAIRVSILGSEGILDEILEGANRIAARNLGKSRNSLTGGGD